MIEFNKLSRDGEDNTKIMAGKSTFSIEQMEAEIDTNTEIGKKLKSVEKELENY